MFEENDKKLSKFNVYIHIVTTVALIFAIIYGIIIIFYDNFISGIIIIAIGIISYIVFYIIYEFLISIALDIKLIRNKCYDIENPVKELEKITQISINKLENIINKSEKSVDVPIESVSNYDIQDLIYRRDMDEISQEEFEAEIEKIKRKNQN